VVGVLDYVAEEGGRGVEVIEDYVDVAAVEEVAEGSASGADDRGQAAARGRRDFGELFAV
jgi:hypothetical protein